MDEVSTKAAQDRLQDIWSDWGLQIAADASPESQLKAIPLIQSIFQKDQATSLVRAYQSVLIDPMIPGSHKRNCIRYFSTRIRDTWRGADTAVSNIRPIKALLLAVLSAKGANFDTNRVSESFKANLIRFSVKDVVSIVLSISEPDTRHEFDSSIPANYPLSLELNTTNKFIKSIDSSEETILNRAATVKYLSQCIGVIRTDIEDTSGKVLNKIQTDIEDILKYLEIHSVTHSRTRKLWWGQSKYSSILECSLRRVADQDIVTLIAAIESSALSSTLNTEPAASYLEEVLHQLGQDLNESKTLLAWMHTQARSPHLDKFPLKEPVTALAKEDPLGLPFTWLVLQEGEDFIDEDAQEAIGIPLDTELDRGEWASLIFREALLHHRAAALHNKEG